MVAWEDFAAEAPGIAGVFVRRHGATANLCFLATLRADGWPRISPMEPRIFEGDLVLVGMDNSRKFADLARDPRFSLHTATVDTHVGDGDAKVSGTVTDVRDEALHARFAEDLFRDSGFDLRGHGFEPYLVADLTDASSLAVDGDELVYTIWKPGQGERVVRRR